MLPLELLSDRSQTCRSRVVGPSVVVFHLINHSVTEVRMVLANVIQQANESVGKLNTLCFPVGQMFVHHAFSKSLVGLDDFSDDEQQLLVTVSFELATSLCISPPLVVLKTIVFCQLVQELAQPSVMLFSDLNHTASTL